MTLLERTAKCLEIKSRISWISAEYEKIKEKIVPSNKSALRHCAILCYDLSAIMEYIKSENLELSLKYSYCEIINELYKELKRKLTINDYLITKKDFTDPLLQ